MDANCVAMVTGILVKADEQGPALWIEKSVVHDGIMDALARCEWDLGTRLIVVDPGSREAIGCIVSLADLAWLQAFDIYWSMRS